MSGETDEARLAAVSRSTVSHVPNDTRVGGDATREAVLSGGDRLPETALGWCVATSRPMTLGSAGTPQSAPYFSDPADLQLTHRRAELRVSAAASCFPSARTARASSATLRADGECAGRRHR
ncbi:MAG: hypothetical protein JWQ37_653 [Blastococcus sp.]|nr:hypothetical protein [Blastococcus sp.]